MFKPTDLYIQEIFNIYSVNISYHDNYFKLPASSQHEYANALQTQPVYDRDFISSPLHHLSGSMALLLFTVPLKSEIQVLL